VGRVALVAPALPIRPPLPAARILVVLPEERAAEAAGLAAPLGPTAAVEIVADADALFRSGLPQLGRAVIAWIAARG
jgi:hypothetical protein